MHVMFTVNVFCWANTTALIKTKTIINIVPFIITLTIRFDHNSILVVLMLKKIYPSVFLQAKPYIKILSIPSKRLLISEYLFSRKNGISNPFKAVANP